MTRRSWFAIAVAAVASGAVTGTLVATDGSSGAPRRHMTRATSTTRSAPPTTTTTTPLLPPAPLPTPVPPVPGDVAPVISRVPTPNRVVFLTIDDGLVRDPRTIELIRETRIPVTLFLVPGPAREGQAYFQQLQALGGTIEAHTVHHPDLKKLGAAAQGNEVCGTLDDFGARFGRRPTLFRPPYGSYNETTKQVARSCGFQWVVTWRATLNDGVLAIQGAQLQPGDIILAHFRTDLPQNILVLLAKLRAENFAVGRLEDYLSPGT